MLRRLAEMLKTCGYEGERLNTFVRIRLTEQDFSNKDYATVIAQFERVGINVKFEVISPPEPSLNDDLSSYDDLHCIVKSKFSRLTSARRRAG